MPTLRGLLGWETRVSKNMLGDHQIAFERYLRNSKRYRWTVIGLLVTLVLMNIGSAAAYLAQPKSIAKLQADNNRLKQQVAALTAPKYPVDTVRFAAYAAALNCVTYTDQAPQSQVSADEAACGWSGSGVANNDQLVYDQDPGLTAPLTASGLSALPFNAQFQGSSDWLRYWVPVQQHGSRAQVAGTPVPLNSQPTFIQNGCATDTTQTASATASIQAVDQVVSGAQRFTVPGLTLAFNGNGLTGATADNETICHEQTGQYLTLVAKVTYKGPTAGAGLSVWYAFRTQVISTGETRVSDLGLYAGGTPGS
ncbi:MAG TPA: hypothetical protein VGH44_06000 [Candidatus Saccharimonadia bacterium]|jgi:hypothetical protein